MRQGVSSILCGRLGYNLASEETEMVNILPFQNSNSNVQSLGHLGPSKNGKSLFHLWSDLIVIAIVSDKDFLTERRKLKVRIMESMYAFT